MLAWLGIELRLVSDRATGALEEQVGAFTAREFGLGAEVTCHLNILLCHLPQTNAGAACGAVIAGAGGGGLHIKLNTTTLLRAAAIVRDRRHVGDRCDTDAQSTEGTNRGFTAWTGALDFDINVLDTLLHGRAASDF